MMKIVFFVAVLTLFVGAIVVVIAVASESTVTSRPERIDLTIASIARARFDAEMGDRLEVSIAVTQAGDDRTRCGEPMVVEDSFGNPMASLKPISSTPGVGATYRYAFYVAASGEYAVSFDNSECNIRQTNAAASITWSVDKQ